MGVKHLFIVQHGMFGTSYFFDNFKKKLESAFTDSIVILPHKNNFVYSTFGTQICGDKLVETIEHVLKSYPDISTMSFVGHSFGGIIARYAIGKLNEKNVFENIKPLAYISISTPHAKVITNNPVVKFALNYCTGLTGKELIGKSPMLDLLSDPESHYLKGLEKFPVKLLYGNLFNDDVICQTACLYHDDKLTSLIEVVSDRLYLVHHHDKHKDEHMTEHMIEHTTEHMTEHKNDPHFYLKKLNWTRKVANLSEYMNSHITIVGRHTFLPFLKIQSEEASVVLLDIILEITTHLNK